VSAPGLDERQRRSLRGFRTSLLLLVLALCIPPIAIRFHLKRQVVAAADVEEPPRSDIGSDASELLRSGRLNPIQGADGGFGLQVDHVTSGGALDRMGFRSGDVITSLNGVSFESRSDASAAIFELAAGRANRIDVEGSDGTTRTIEIRASERDGMR
jgi:S1-C subfamily serine protease